MVYARRVESGIVLMESIIDERYRLDLIRHHLEEVEEKAGKSIFFCPLCQSDRPKGKYTQKKGAMFWSEEWSAWRFNCLKCLRQATTMYRYLLLVNQGMAQQYQRDRFHAGRTGKGSDCPNPAELKYSYCPKGLEDLPAKMAMDSI